MFQRSNFTGSVDETERKIVTVLPVGPSTNPVENAAGDGQVPATVAPLRKRTQEDQDNADEVARRRALKELVQSWMERLQLISLITTFFASVEAGLIQVTVPNPLIHYVSGLEKAANATLIGALIMHVNAAIISFLAAFFLIRYKLKEAKKEEMKIEEHILQHFESPDVEKGSTFSYSVQTAPSNPAPAKKTTASEPPIFAADPHLEQVGPFRRSPPTHLLARCHALCVTLAALGFILALAGIILFVWAKLPHSVGVFASVCMASCIVGGAAFLWSSD